MSGALRRLAQTTASRFSQANRDVCAQQVQKRFAGDLPVKPNKHIEDWGTYREHIEDTFTFDAKTLTSVFLAAVVFPVFLYKNIVSEFHKVDEIAGRKPRDFM